MPPPAEGFASRLFLAPALRTQPDRRLVTLVREGYEVAFEEIVRRYGKPLSRYAASIVGSRSEDVAQDAFSKALLALRRDDTEIDLRPWLFRIVRNTALNDLRDSPPSPEVLAEAIAGGRNPAEELERREELTDLMRRLQALPEPQRAAIVMRELEGLSHNEIAAALGLTGGGARQAIYRARQTLRDGLGMLVPLPILQAMLAGSGPGAAEAAAGAAGVGSAAGAGIALKATAATVLVAGAVGAGVAIKENPHSGDARAAPVLETRGPARQTAPAPVANVQEESGSDARHRGSGGENAGQRGRGGSEPRDNHGMHGEGGLGDDRSGEPELVDDHGGRGRGGSGEDRGGSGPSGHHGEHVEDDHSGPSRGGDGSGSDDRSGPGPGGSGSSGISGSGDSGFGGGGSGSGSGSGSGDGSDPSDDMSGGGGPEPSGEPAVDDDSGSSSGPGPGGDSKLSDDHSGGPG